MDEDDGAGRRIDLLKKALAEVVDIKSIPTFAFDSVVVKLTSVLEIHEPRGFTDMAKAFNEVRRYGYTNLILVTDGYPDNAEQALNAAIGMCIDIVYVGPEPIPRFLQRLADQCQGTLQIGKLADVKAITRTITGLLPDYSRKVLCG